MDKHETSKASVDESEEVSAYPLVLKLIAVNWAVCALENPDEERKHAFALAEAYSSLIMDDIVRCHKIAADLGMDEGCTRRHVKVSGFIKPMN